MQQLYTGTFTIGTEEFILAATEQGVAYFDLLKDSVEDLPNFFKGYQIIEDPSKIEAYIPEVRAYFQQECTTFTFELDLVGTAFQQEVWQALRQIPYGQTTSYSALAEQIGRPKAYRAVANAVGRNPLLVIVPCHRVLGKDGSLTGFRGGLPLKRRLLKIEGHAY